jgi:hypothetical protein
MVSVYVFFYFKFLPDLSWCKVCVIIFYITMVVPLFRITDCIALIVFDTELICVAEAL